MLKEIKNTFFFVGTKMTFRIFIKTIYLTGFAKSLVKDLENENI